MNFRLAPRDVAILSTVTGLTALFQVLTPVLLRTLIDGILPSRDLTAMFTVLAVMGLSEGFHLLANGIMNRELDDREGEKLLETRAWLIVQGIKPQSDLADPDRFYTGLTSDVKRLVYKRVKNPWYRAKDFIVLFLLSLISIKISYLAGFLIVAISLLSLALVYFAGESQGRAVKDLVRKSEREKNHFEHLRNGTKGMAHDAFIAAFEAESREVTQAQQSIAKERTRGQDINNGVRFSIMFLILTVGGYLFAKDQLSMGSLWALVITMMRITPTLQSIIRWLQQSRGEQGLEERILESLRQKNHYQKPSFYNRLVKIIEKSISTPGQRFVAVSAQIQLAEVAEAIEYWKGFYLKKSSIASKLDGEETTGKIYLVLEPVERIPTNVNATVFGRRESAPTDMEVFEL